MIGLIVTGHGNFATGITSSFRLIAGDVPDYEAVDFLPEDSIEMLTEKLSNAVARLDAKIQPILQEFAAMRPPGWTDVRAFWC